MNRSGAAKKRARVLEKETREQGQDEMELEEEKAEDGITVDGTINEELQKKKKKGLSDFLSR